MHEWFQEVWLDITSSESQGVAKWIGVIFSGVLALLGLRGWYAHKKQRRLEGEAQARADLDARFAHKAELADVEAIHERIERHKKANDVHVEGLHKLIEQLGLANERHRRIEEKLFDKVEKNAELAANRHIELVTLLARKGLPMDKGNGKDEG